MLRRIVFCLLLCLVPWALAAQEKAVDIFILSSHTSSSEWEQNMLEPFHSVVQDRPDIRMSIARLQLLSHPDVASLQQQVKDELDSLTLRPRLVVLLGGSCFNFAPDIQKRWESIPILLVGEQDYYCDIEYTLFGPGDPNARRYPVDDLRHKGYNLSLINAPAFIRRTVEMILALQPRLEKLYFVAGENYHCKERQWRLENYLSDYHPEIDFQVISSGNNSTDQLLAILGKEGGPHRAAIFGSWLTREAYLDNVSTRHNIISLLDDLVPVYTLFASDLEKHPYLMGYYSYPRTDYGRTVRQTVLDILDNGVQPRDIPFANLNTGIPTLNYRAMEHYGLDTSLIPEDATVVGTPLTLWQSYKKQILLIAFLLLAGLAGFFTVSMTHSMRSLRKARNLAEKASNLKSAFIQNMSHEVRTPLNAITGFSQLLCLPDGLVSDEEKQEYLGYILNNSNLLTVMVNDLLNMADMENGEYPVHKAPTNLNEMARQAIKSTEFRVPPGVQLIRQPGLDEEARYITDGMRVQQIMINFLTNACKHTTSGEIVFGSSLTENPGYITFYVADTGPGVPKEEAENIFDRFVKLDPNKQGAGLGLSICRLVAHSLGGKVWLDTSYTDGARFVLTIPREEA